MSIIIIVQRFAPAATCHICIAVVKKSHHDCELLHHHRATLCTRGDVPPAHRRSKKVASRDRELHHHHQVTVCTRPRRSTCHACIAVVKKSLTWPRVLKNFYYGDGTPSKSKSKSKSRERERERAKSNGRARAPLLRRLLRPARPPRTSRRCQRLIGNFIEELTLGSRSGSAVETKLRSFRAA